MKNIPYKKETDQFGKIINLSKEQPFVNKFPKQPKKNSGIYLMMNNGTKIKNKGNNRASKTKRKGKQSRLYQRFIG